MARGLDILFHLVQWMLLAYGVLFFVVGVHLFFALDWRTSSSLPVDGDFYTIPLWERFLQSTIHGSVALGLSGILFRLRHLYARRQA